MINRFVKSRCRRANLLYIDVIFVRMSFVCRDVVAALAANGMQAGVSFLLSPNYTFER